jgi:hypothetical protein
VATFAVRAVAHAGLLQPYGTFYDYEGLDRADTGWLANFVAAECTRTVQVETCNRIARGNPPRLHVDLVEDRFVVLGAEGPMNTEQRAKLLSYTEEANSEPDHWEYPVVAVKDALVDRDTTDIKATGIWTGPIPGGGSSTCTLTVFNDSGDVVVEKALPLREAPQAEEARAGDFIGTSMSSQSDPATAPRRPASKDARGRER